MGISFQQLTPQIKQSLFNISQFRADLTLSHSSPIPAYKKGLKNANATLEQWFDESVDISVLVHSKAWLVDQILTLAWEHYNWNNLPSISLLAVGGYGRGELHPGSDIDILILLDNEQYSVHQQNIETFLTLLWDIGLTVSPSVRSINECKIQATKDLSIITNLMESRTVVGSSHLYDQLQACISTEKIWPSNTYLQAKLEEHRNRHQKYNDTEYTLEPNIKSSPGNLRDLHMLGWVALRHYGTYDPNELAELKFLSKDEYHLLIKCRNFLWKVRWKLHTLNNRCEDRLLFEYQQVIAKQFGYQDHKGSLAVEQFMQEYFRMVMTIAQLKDVLLQHFDDDILHANRASTIVSINERFQTYNNYIETTNSDVFTNYPPAILEVFVLMTRSPTILGARATTIRLLSAHSHLIDRQFQTDHRCTRLFLELMHAPYNMTSTLRRMALYGILGRYLPEFGCIIGKMQFDLFHAHTVDVHILLLIKYLRSFTYKENEQRYPFAARAMKKIAKPRLLYIAAIYHDVAKGRGGDHSLLGAVDAEKFCRRHALDNGDTSLVVWLVKEHLTMSITAQRQDITDPEIIQAFARKVETTQKLNCLYALTVADINATNPQLWNSWRASLLQQLYTATRQMLKRGIDNLPSRADQIKNIKLTTLALIPECSHQMEKIIRLWQYMEPAYFTSHEPEDLAWQTTDILTHTNKKPLIVVRETLDNEENRRSKVFIYIYNQPNLFAATVAALDQMNLIIQDATIFTSSNNFATYTFTVLERDGSAINKNSPRVSLIQRHLKKVLTSPEHFPSLIQRRTPRQLRHFSSEPVVLLSSHIKSKKVELNIVATDRPGLLALIGKTFMKLAIEVHRAKIATFGEKVEDFFIITSAKSLLDDKHHCETICNQMTQVLKAATARGTL